MKSLFIVSILLLTGCSNLTENPIDVECEGKGVITGTGSVTGVSIIGLNGNNNWTIQADCGSGFKYRRIAP